MGDVPNEVLAEIRRAARTEWPDDPEMRAESEQAEINAYRDFVNCDFGTLGAEVAESLKKDALEIFESWGERAEHIREEIKAAHTIMSFEDARVPKPILREILRASSDPEDSYWHRLETIRTSVEDYLRDQATRKKVDPIKDLLVALESTIGKECYNGAIQNYGPWGQYVGSGRIYRYPVTFGADKGSFKRWHVPRELDSETLVTGHYVLGKNQLYIFGALIKVLELMESRYGLDFAELEGKRAAQDGPGTGARP